MLFIIIILYVGGLGVALLLIIRVEVVLEYRGTSFYLLVHVIESLGVQYTYYIGHCLIYITYLYILSLQLFVFH